MIRYVDGDLVKMAKEGKFDVIAHGCNCFLAFGAGIAPQIKHAFPEAYAADCATVAGDESKMGTITHTVNTTPTVVNIYSQYDDWDIIEKIIEEEMIGEYVTIVRYVP